MMSHPSFHSRKLMTTTYQNLEFCSRVGCQLVLDEVRIHVSSTVSSEGKILAMRFLEESKCMARKDLSIRC
jgi:hypothetical protein